MSIDCLWIATEISGAARGYRLSHDAMEEEQCLQILKMIPEGLRRAREGAMGFIALGTTLSPGLDISRLTAGKPVLRRGRCDFPSSP